MNTPVSPPKTLSQIRTMAGKSTRQAANELAIYLKENARSHVSILSIEKHGTQKYEVMMGLAEIYGVPFDEINQAIKNIS
jgi:transcriptional regulator with XRE-family HTH domain